MCAATGNIASVRLDHLDWEDDFFAIESFVSCEHLYDSLRRCGILFAPWLWEREGERYVIVDGFKRLQWMKAKGEVSAECLVFSKDSDRLDLLLARMEGKLFGPPLNVSEKARIISKLSLLIPDDELALRFLRALDVPLRPDAVKKWRLLAASDEALLEAAASEEICERAALDLISWEDENEAAKEALALLRELRCSASIQMEILDRVTEIARGRERHRLEVLRDPELRAVRTQPGWNHREKTQAIRDLLTRQRFPRLKAREERFLVELEAASLPNAMRLLPPPAFEGERWQLHLSFSSPEEVRLLLDKARELAESAQLQKIMSSRYTANG